MNASESPSREPEAAPWRDALWIVLLSPALVAGCYSVGFIEFDDAAHYRHEVMDVPWAKVFHPTENSTYLPLTIITYRFDRWLYEQVLPQPWPSAGAAPGVRFNSLLLHVLAGIFLWRALLLLKLGRWLSLFAAAGWTMHPAACESVCWISERKNTLAALFGFASLCVYFGAVQRAWLRIALTGVLFVLAMLGKPNAAGFLVVYVLFDLYVLSQRRRGAEPSNSTVGFRAWNILFYAALAGIILGLAIVNVNKTQEANATRVGGSIWAVVLTDVPILWDYVSNSLVPVGLSIFYHSHIVTSLADGVFWTRLSLLLALFGVTVWISPNRERTVLLWGWFVGALGPALNVIPIPYLMQDRYAYFSLPAILAIGAETLAQVFLRLVPKPSANLPKFAAIAGILGLALLAFFRSDVYRNDFVLFHDAVAKQPASAYARSFYGLTLAEVADVNEYSGKGDPEGIVKVRREALEHLEASQRCDDFDRLLEQGRARIMVGVLMERLGRDKEATPLLEREMVKPQKPYNNVVACQSLARIALRAGNAAEALKWVERGINAFPDPLRSPEMLYLKGMSLEALNRSAEARAIYMLIPKNSLAYPRAQARLAALEKK